MDRRRIALAIGGGCLAVALVTGCSPQARHKVMSFFFDGYEDTLPPPRTRVHRDRLKEIEELKRELAEAVKAVKAAREKSAAEERAKLPTEEAKTWAEAAELLPKDGNGAIDWGTALRDEVIAPRPGLGPKAKDQAVLDLDVELASSGNKLFSVTLSHEAHTRWLACGNCHPAIFPLKRGAEPVVATMAKIQAGQYCGACHGKVAFSVEGQCARCHAKIPAKADWRPPEEPQKPIERAKTWDEAAKLLPVTGGVPDWAKALAEGVIAPRPGLDPKAADQPVFPITVERVPTGQEVFKAIFPHAAHTAVLGCANCHPTIFQMARGTTPMNMGLIYAGQACGLCHGKVAFPVTACGRCHPAMAPK